MGHCALSSISVCWSIFLLLCTQLSNLDDKTLLNLANLQLCGEGPGCPGRRQVNHEPAVCPGCQEGQWDPGAHQEECGQQDEGGSPSPLHCPGEASSGAICPVLGSPVQER